jgi:diacylglycerol kinase (ATP)
LWLATLNSLRGLKHCYHSEAAFRQEVWAALVLVPLAIWLGQTAVERALLVGSVLVVMIV